MREHKITFITEECSSRNRRIELTSENMSHILQYFPIHIPHDHLDILDILYSYYVSNQGKIVNSCRIRSHIGIHGNKEADKGAKSAIEFEILKFKIPSTDLKHFIKHL